MPGAIARTRSAGAPNTSLTSDATYSESVCTQAPLRSALRMRSG